MILGWIDEAVDSGARLESACEIVGIDARTTQRWRRQGVGADRRAGPKREPKNKITGNEREQILAIVKSPEYFDLSVKQIVPRLADQGVYLVSESTAYRILREEKMLAHRARSRPPTSKPPRELIATAPNQVWSWDITYLHSPIRGIFFYLYMAIDVFSRKIVAAGVHANEDGRLAAQMIEDACRREGIGLNQLTIHSDNGAPMKSGTLHAKMNELRVANSFSRPGVSDDNPFSEALFRTLKYSTGYPTKPFGSVDAAQAWVDRFVHWYNTIHRHSGIRYVTPDQRHRGLDREILQRRVEVYREARMRHPMRWSRSTRDWSRVDTVELNPSKRAS